MDPKLMLMSPCFYGFSGAASPEAVTLLLFHLRILGAGHLLLHSVHLVHHVLHLLCWQGSYDPAHHLTHLIHHRFIMSMFSIRTGSCPYRPSWLTFAVHAPPCIWAVESPGVISKNAAKMIIIVRINLPQ